MKKTFVLIASLLITAMLAAQEVKPVQEKNQVKTKTQQTEQVKQDNHGQAVSQTAKTTESGPGKGEIVSQQAKTQSEAKKAEKEEKASAKNQKGNTANAARGNTVQKNAAKTAAKGGGRK